jgi:uncharacterized surface protein with fasciclin (FAS1) repeats
MKSIVTILAVAVLVTGSAMTTIAGDKAVESQKAAKKETKDQKKMADIVDTALNAGSFKTLTAALQAAGLVEALRGEGPFTVFAPTDEAFAKLPEGTVETLLKPENREKLVDILTYHVVAGRLEAKNVVATKGATALNKGTLEFASTEAGVMVSGAKVIQADILCTNGVVHVIDTVLIPN